MSTPAGYGRFVELRSHGPSAAARAGALAVLVRSLATASFRSPHTGMTSYDPEVPKIPAAAVSTEDADCPPPRCACARARLSGLQDAAGCGFRERGRGGPRAGEGRRGGPDRGASRLLGPGAGRQRRRRRRGDGDGSGPFDRRASAAPPPHLEGGAVHERGERPRRGQGVRGGASGGAGPARRRARGGQRGRAAGLDSACAPAKARAPCSVPGSRRWIPWRSRWRTETRRAPIWGR